MSFLDKVKQFVGGKGMASVSITSIERQAPEKAAFRITDSVLKGTMVITAEQECTLLATKYQIWLHVRRDGNMIDTPILVREAQDPDPSVTYSDDCLKMPCDLKPGQVITQPWMVSDIDLPRVLARNSFPDANAAADDARVRLVVKCIADVKGSPFDPSAEVVVDLVPT